MPEFNLVEKKGVIELIIPEGTSKPYKAPDGFYFRFGATSQKLNRDSILQFAIRENRIQFDSQINSWVKKFERGECYDPNKFQRFRDISGLDSSISDVNLITNLNLINIEKQRVGFTNALLLLFSPKPSKFFPQSRIIIWIMRDEVQIIKQFIIEGDLFSQLSESISFLESYLERTYEIKSVKREERGEIPVAVLRELIINAIVHRDYFEKGAEVQIKLFPDRLQISNPCSLPIGFSISSIYGNSLRRNPILAEIFQRAGFMERAGTGLIRIDKILSEHGLSPCIFSLEGSFFIADVLRKQEISQDINENQKKILTSLTGNKELTSKQLAEILGYTDRTIRNELNELQKMKLIVKKRIGRSIFYLKCR
jgi:ATP-dependent DNA helicase RecG